MVAIRQGEWAILSVQVDEDSVVDQRGFERLELCGSELTISPSGLRFVVQQSTSHSAVLESHGQVYFADYATKGNEQDHLRIELSRPQFAEKILIEAQFDR